MIEDIRGEDQCASCGAFESQGLLVMVGNEFLCQECHDDYQRFYADEEED